MKAERRLDLLESDVMARIASHRQAQKSLRSLPVAALVCAIALAGGWLTGMEGSRQKSAAQPAGSESALMADDMRLAPSSLLANNQ
jgi:hypothetical protein